MTTFEPGASEVLTHGFACRPRATALRASSPAPTITDGFEVFVQLVIAAITTWPWSSSKLSPSSVDGRGRLLSLERRRAPPAPRPPARRAASGSVAGRAVGGRVRGRVGLGDRLVVCVARRAPSPGA